MIRKYPIFLLIFFWMSTTEAQKVDTLIKKLDSLHRENDSSGKSFRNINQNIYNEKTRITVPVYFVLLGTDFTQEVTGPFHSSSKSWNKVAAFAVIEAGLFLADKPIQRYATQLMDRNQKFQGLSHYVSNFGATYEGYTLGALGLYSLVFKNQKLKTTTLLATQSYLVAGAVEALTKFITGEQRPNYVDPKGGTPHPAFHGPSFSLKTGSTGFPSGHTTAAFAAATVFAQEYRDRPLVTIISYSAATLIGLSRITENAHWMTDVFAGAALGYVTGLQVVRNYHRYAYIRNHASPVRSVSLSAQFNYDHVEPALVIDLK